MKQSAYGTNRYGNAAISGAPIITKVAMLKKESKKILVVDDDDSIRSLCEEILEAAGYSVEAAPNGMDALDMIKRSSYDLVISDINMPELNGIDLYKKAVEYCPTVKERFLFMTGYMTGDGEEVIRRARLKYLSKPFRIKEMIECVEALTGLNDDASRTKRREDRFKVEVECDVFEEDKKHRFITAKTLDLSRNGIRIFYENEAIAPGTEVNLYINVNCLNMRREARTLWSAGMSGGSFASGLVLRNPMPVASIINIMPEQDNGHGGRAN